MEQARYHFTRLKDFLYCAISKTDHRIASMFRIGNLFVKVWLHDSDFVEVLECTEVIDGDIIEFDPLTGKYKSVKTIQLTPQKYYFIVLRPKSLALPGNIHYSIHDESCKRTWEERR